MTDTPHTSPDTGLRVLVAGGGIAALEAAFALHELAGDRVHTRVLCPGDEFVDRPRTIAVPFNRGFAERYPLAPLIARAGAEFEADELVAVDVNARIAITSEGARHPYDALIVATGATPQPRFAHATTIDDGRMDELLHGLVMDIEQGYVRRLAVVVPTRVSWPLPAYEAALMASERAWDMQAQTEIVLLTPEHAPLEMFGATASQRVGQLLAERGIELITGAVSDVTTSRSVVTHPSGRVVEADRIVALPELRGPRIPGLPSDREGFVPVDRYGRVHGVEGVWAAGDITDVPVKQGGIAAELADVIAADIAARAGALVTVVPFAPSLRAVLMTGGRPRYLYARPAGPSEQPVDSTFSDRPLDGSDDKVLARYLTPHLHALRASGVGAGTCRR